MRPLSPYGMYFQPNLSVDRGVKVSKYLSTYYFTFLVKTSAKYILKLDYKQYIFLITVVYVWNLSNNILHDMFVPGTAKLII